MLLPPLVGLSDDPDSADVQLGRRLELGNTDRLYEIFLWQAGEGSLAGPDKVGRAAMFEDGAV